MLPLLCRIGEEKTERTGYMSIIYFNSAKVSASDHATITHYTRPPPSLAQEN